MTSNLIYSIRIPRKQQSQFIGCSIMSRYPNPVYDQFAAKLNLQLKPHANDIKIRPNFIHVAISPSLYIIWIFNLFWGDFLTFH
jgi:hypothetical protein